MNQSSIIQTTKNWINTFVIQLNLCPFAQAEIKNDRVNFQVIDDESPAQVLQQLQCELNYLAQHPKIETTLLIHPNALLDFADYNDFLERCDDLLIDMQLEGVYQLASFHPDYQFADTQIDDAENYSNKSPYPMLHILREATIEHAVSQYPNAHNIPEKNIKTLKTLGANECRDLLNKCLE